MKHYPFLLLFIMGILNSCSSDFENEIKNDSAIESEFFTSKFIYNDIEYTVPCELIGDSLIFHNEEFNSIYKEEISQFEELTTFIREDGAIEYFANISIVGEKYDLPSIDMDLVRANPTNIPTTKVAGYNLNFPRDVTLYDDVNFKDTHYGFYVDNQHEFIAIPHLKPTFGFNDKTSSIKVLEGKILQAWENDNYSGRSIIVKVFSMVIVPPAGVLNGGSSNLKQVPCGSGNWNDRITSVLIHHDGYRPPGYPN